MCDFDLSDVETRVQNLRVDEARTLYLQEIFDWTDSFNENLGGSTSSIEGRVAFNKLSELWVNYAKFEINLKQWKKAVQVFEDALNDSVVSRSAFVYVAYADFCKSRNKQSNALKVYFRGLLASLDEEDYDIMWIQLAEFMRQTSNEAPIFDELFSAVIGQIGQDIRKPSDAAVEKICSVRCPEINSSLVADECSDLKDSSNGTQPNPIKLEPAPDSAIKNISSTLNGNPEEGVAIKSSASGTIYEPAAYVPDNFEDYCRHLSIDELHSSFSHRPASIFTAPDKEPMMSGFDGVAGADAKNIESYLQMKSQEDDKSDLGSYAPRVLDLLYALYCNQAFYERQFDMWFSMMMQGHSKEEREIMLACESRDKKSRDYQTEIAARRRLHKVQFDVLNGVVNHIQTSLLREQQQILCSIQFPYFSETPRSDDQLKKSTNTNLSDVYRQRTAVCGALSARLKSTAQSAVFFDRENREIDTSKKRKTRRKFSGAELEGAAGYYGSAVVDQSKKKLKTDDIRAPLLHGIESNQHTPAMQIAPALSAFSAVPLVNQENCFSYQLGNVGQDDKSGDLRTTVDQRTETLPLLRQLAKMIHDSKKV